MKVLQQFDIFTPEAGGGTVSLISRLSQALAKKGHEVAIYTGDFHIDWNYVKAQPDVKIAVFHDCLGIPGICLMPGMAVEMRRNLKEFDVIHMHWHRSFQAIMVHHYAKKYGIPYVVDDHGTPHGGVGTTRFKQWLRWIYDLTFGPVVLRDAARVISETERGINEYKELGVKLEKIAVVRPPVEVEQYFQLPSPGVFRKKYDIDVQKRIILFLGRINQIKGLDFLVESFCELAKSRDDALLVMVGSDDGHKANLERLINKLHIQDKVLFTGYLTGKDKLSALVDADVLVQTSIYEHGTGPPFEAILCNTPVIVTKHTGSGENIGKLDAGYLVEYGNNKELKETMEYVLDHSAEAKSKTLKAKEYIKTNLCTAKGVERYEKLFQEVIAEYKKRYNT